MPYLKERHTELYYELHGSGTPIIFLHPPVMGHLTFRFQRPLEKHYQLIFIDLINSGRSTKENQAVTISELAALVYSLTKKLHLQKVILCGYSNGGSIAQEFALTYPEKTAALILIGGFPEVSTFLLKRQFKVGMWAAKKKLLHLFAYILPLAHFESKQYQNEMAHFIRNADGETLKNIYEKGMNYVSTDRLDSLSVPLLLLYGEYDLYMRSYLFPFCQKVKDVEVVFVNEVAHQVPTKRPDECNTIIHNWIQRKRLDARI